MSTALVITPPAPVLLPGVQDSSLSDYVIPPAMRALVYAFQQVNGAPVPTNLLTILTTMALVFSGDINVESLQGGTIPLTFYALVASGTGEGKTRVLHTVMEPVNSYESQLKNTDKKVQDRFMVELKRWNAEGRSLKYLLEKAVREGSESSISCIENDLLEHQHRKPYRPTPNKKIVTDVTLRGLRDALMAADGESLVLTNSDSSRFFHETLIKNAPEFCSAWSGEPINIANRGIEIRAEKPRLSMILMVQPAMIEDFFKQDHEFRYSGLGARFITFMPDPLIGQRWRIPNQPIDLYKQSIADWNDKIKAQLEKSRLRRVACGSPDSEIIKLSPEAKQFLHSYGLRIDSILGNPSGEYADICDIALRLIEQTCKIAGLFELFEDPHSREVKPHNVEFALNFMLEHANSYKKICSPNKPRKSDIVKANSILNFLNSGRHSEQFYIQNQYRTNNGVRMEEYQRFGPIRKKKEYEEPLRLLEINNKIEIKECSVTRHNGISYRKVIFVIDPSPLQDAIQSQQCKAATITEFGKADYALNTLPINPEFI